MVIGAVVLLLDDRAAVSVATQVLDVVKKYHTRLVALHGHVTTRVTVETRADPPFVGSFPMNAFFIRQLFGWREKEM